MGFCHLLCGNLRRLFGNLKWSQSWKQGILISAGQWTETLLLSFLVSLPFTLTFDSGMAQGVRLTQNHSALYQLCILWAFPVLAVLIYLIALALEQGTCRPLSHGYRGYFHRCFVPVRHRADSDAGTGLSAGYL